MQTAKEFVKIIEDAENEYQVGVTNHIRAATEASTGALSGPCTAVMHEC